MAERMTKDTSKTVKAVRQDEPELIAPVKVEAVKRDPRMCTCKDVTRRWDVDGLALTEDGTNYYTCSKCGKLYD